jgi:uncharacterized protein YeaO (DUF488 family)
MIKLKRVYEKPSHDDGLRILVDRLWPRGVTKLAARVDLWLKDIAPSPALRTWFGHDPARWTEFRRRYFDELKERADAVAELRSLIAAQPVTFVYAAKDSEHTHALALKDFAERKSKRARARKVTKRRPPARRRAAPRRRS